MAEARDWIRNHRGRFLRLTLTRARMSWFPDADEAALELARCLADYSDVCRGLPAAGPETRARSSFSGIGSARLSVDVLLRAGRHTLPRANSLDFTSG